MSGNKFTTYLAYKNENRLLTLTQYDLWLDSGHFAVKDIILVSHNEVCSRKLNDFQGL